MTDKAATPAAAVVLMGVCGSGKSTIGHALALATGGRFFDGDDFHSPANVEKMRAGVSLTDFDRQGWLETLRDLIDHECHDSTGAPVFLACSALKESYRAILRAGAQDVRFVFLHGSPELIRARMMARSNHFMPETLIDSQFQTLEAPADALVVDISLPPEAVVARIMEHLRLIRP
ncbi:MAG: gluconokinase [Luteolibacter sp.]